MEKKFCAYIFAITFVAFSTVVHGQPELASRNPSVEPIVEVDIQDAKHTQSADSGYDFAKKEPVAARVPANIVAKAQAVTPTSYLGPIIFLIALPIGLWIMIARKFSKKSDEKKVDYYSKTHQFKPYKTEYQKLADDEDDIDFPKAS